MFPKITTVQAQCHISLPITGNKKDDKQYTSCPKFLLFSVTGAGLLIKPGFIVTFCSVRKLCLAVPNTVCCSAEHRRPDNNLAAKTSKNKSCPFFFFSFFSPLQGTVAASHLPPGPNRQASSGGGAACVMLNSKIVSFWFSAAFCSGKGVLFSDLGSGGGNKAVKGAGWIQTLVVGWGCPQRSFLGGPSGNPLPR